MKKHWTAFQITKLAILLALALMLSILEAWLLPKGILPLPGLKLGLANIAILVTLYTVGKKEALLLAILRSLVVLVLGGNFVGFVFSMLGGVWAWFAMCLLCERKHVSIFGTSIGGAACHSIGQIMAAMLMTRTVYVLVYLPYLILASCAMGAVIAFLTIPVVRALDHLGNPVIQ